MMSPVEVLVQQTPSAPMQFLGMIPVSVQVLAGGAALAGIAWKWVIDPRMASRAADNREELRKVLAKEVAEKFDAQSAKFDAQSARIDAQSVKIDDLSKKVDDLSKKVDDQSEKSDAQSAKIDDLSKEIADTRETLRKELSEKTDDTREGLRKQIAGSTAALRKEIAENTAALRREIAENTAALRREIAENTAALRRESAEAHAAIGDRIDGLRDFVAQENKEIRADIADMKTDTAKLAGAVDVLADVVLPRGDRQGYSARPSAVVREAPDQSEA